jgi:TM2 domain-containing membrane protein YozV
MYCNKCGKEIDDEALICPHCGCGTVNYVRDQAKAEARVQAQPAPGQKTRTTALLLCIFLGGLGAHRFYVGKIGTGILWLLTLGFGGIGTIVDLICIICGTFTDEFGHTLYDPRVRIVSNSDTTGGNASGAVPAAAYQPAVMTQEEYDEATKAPRTVRKIVLIVLAVVILLYIISSYHPELLDIFRR